MCERLSVPSLAIRSSTRQLKDGEPWSRPIPLLISKSSKPLPVQPLQLRRTLQTHISEEGTSMEQINEQHPHGGDWLREIVFGLNDGLVTTLVFIMAVSGVASGHLVL